MFVFKYIGIKELLKKRCVKDIRWDVYTDGIRWGLRVAMAPPKLSENPLYLENISCTFFFIWALLEFINYTMAPTVKFLVPPMDVDMTFAFFYTELLG